MYTRSFHILRQRKWIKSYKTTESAVGDEETSQERSCKKLGLDTSDVSNYRPISNLKVISKLLERLVVSQLMAYLSDNNLLPDHQSADRAFCSTETHCSSTVRHSDRAGLRRYSHTPCSTYLWRSTRLTIPSCYVCRGHMG